MSDLQFEVNGPVDDDDLRPRVVPVEELTPERIDQDALRVISRLSRNGYEAYLVGGCVRDLLLSRKPKDFDVATEAHPRQIKRLFRNGRIIGRRFKLVHVVYGDTIIETATFRREPESKEGEDEDLLITEDNVFGNAQEDALRRDFTINALFFNPESGDLIDHVSGLDDLSRGLLRTIGPAQVRFAEDPVRILRAVKFATRLGFRIEEETWQAMCDQAELLTRSAAPRVAEEIFRLMRSGTSLGAFRMLRACGALRVVLPFVDEFLGPRDDPDPAAHDRADSYWRLLEALDAYVHSREMPSDALLLATLFLRVIGTELDPKTRTLPGPPGDLASVTEEVFNPVASPARLSRRIVSRARRIILNQPRFTQTSSKNFRPVLFMRQESFAESLALFRLRCAAWGQGWDVYEGWVERYRRALEVPEEELAGMRKKRKRRRRPRRRSSGGDGEAE